MPRTKLMLSSELDEYFRTWKDDQGSFNGSLQFYRTKREDWEDERAIMGKTIGMPVFCVIPTHDPIAKQDVLDRMKAFIPRFEPASVPGGHWVLQDKNVRDELGDMIGAFFDRIRAENGQARL
ncbi:hypothetical protein DFJ74DRAFT_688661 [Hyaloraphidium curvatum]|nr:hypothetical protein DFJ74DRAFT_688661 [Hyaloraphidium curvatum]